MQKLVGSDIRDTVATKINAPLIVKAINDELGKYIEEIGGILENYEYSKTGKVKNFQQNRLIEIIIEGYFDTKSLNKKNQSTSIKIDDLSSGEKRQALIEVAYAFLMKEPKRKKLIMLAIDEPEASLHTSACFDQFERLKRLSEYFQVITTTHWYGFLPIINDGVAHFLRPQDENIQFESYNLSSYKEQIANQKRGRIPTDFDLKSTHDLVQSIFYSIQLDSPFNWLICEGYSDYLYLTHYFKNEIETYKLRILPVGGNSEVKKIYEFLLLPLKGIANPKGKIYCLIDTDVETLGGGPTNNIQKSILFRRLFWNKATHQIELLEVDSNKTVVTEIEDALIPDIFISTLSSFVGELGFDLPQSTIKVEAKYSCESLDLLESNREKLEKFFTPENKVKFAYKYCELDKGTSVPAWVSQIGEFFSK
ncbi:MAG: hypothetical protein A2600_05515 [Candidatus Lambdaproteobacteria bacterium RIFOXYD1_FULL_56_27]|uniref:Endonuclease GajA/Old nuclease/RecF-like AAA domain-containing protein n=1 Tax=Candidatus Lambdaproteobacteria bacterium RIFOXYD2_FULL_56_26 TaxID=1817773 RepID=A0A1F6GRG5_9PROT|nr:MAG: hypothetical protein A2426_10720 [Candidatus Lambdaproteobacteria bacterium RIFOXYC1_FULL_56_13]OGH00659.1 MAG: hypothetical protein A2557_03220 [Candidatus Lambdaproteobacteria bacterium RIFOXYD2_FULL_56_26]OGH07826.1 MAG: hypothetical protein A2600_05515 [Candidatus Lambdaproteobacteria bacterium RIFOXYD1_FULL_56_27]